MLLVGGQVLAWCGKTGFKFVIFSGPSGVTLHFLILPGF